MNRYYLIIPFLLAYMSMAFGQTKEAFLKAAEEKFMEQNYYSSLSYNLEAYEFDTTDFEVIHDIAESARLFSAYTLADKFYAKSVELDDENKYPMDSYWLAHAKQKLGQYADARTQYNIFLSEYEEVDPYFTARAQKEIKACDWAIELIDNPRTYMTVNRMGDGINTEFSEFGAVKSEGGLYFTSLRFNEMDPEKKPARLISKILYSNDDIESDTLNSELNKDNLFTAHSTFNKDRTKIYFTLCEYINGADIRCDLFQSEMTGDNVFSLPTKLPDSINDPIATNTQPAYAIDKVTGQERLYFVSDREGGKGKLDLWYIDISDTGEYSLPMNLPNINTSENDITPFYDNENRTLYFSSDGYRSLGGYDVFQSKESDGLFGKVDHMGTPINSSFDDVYYSTDSEAETAYFSSNRYGSRFIDVPQEACCYDIYKVNIEDVELSLNAKSLEAGTLDSLTGVTVKLYDAETGELISEVRTDNGIDHLFDLDPDRDYMIIGEKMNYKSDTIMLNTHGMYTTEEIERSLFLELEQVCLDLSTFDEASGAGLDGATVTITDLSDPNAEDIVITNPDSNRVIVKLDPNKSYRVEIKKEGFEPQTFIIDENTKKDGGIIKRKIFMKKRDLNIFLPALLYFDNDRPDRKTMRVTTAKTYTETYNPYISRKEYFLQRTGRGLNGSDKTTEMQRMDDFFEYDVKGGYAKLNLFLQQVGAKLVEGYDFEILIKGHASPLAPNSYNENLSKRRINSVKNELGKYNGGVLLPYMDSGRLKITDASYGEDLSPGDVDDRPSNQTKSIFSVEASKERRVEIIKIKSSSN